MPEIWLPYGEVEVAVDIKAENLGDIIQASDEERDDTISSLSFRDFDVSKKNAVVLGNLSNQGIKFLRSVIENTLKDPSASGNVDSRPAEKKQVLTVLVDRRQVNPVRKKLQGLGVGVLVPMDEVNEIGTADSTRVLVSKSLQAFDVVYLFSEAMFDPFFGFGGGPVSLMQTLGNRMLPEAFKAHGEYIPKPGEENSLHSFCKLVVDSSFPDVQAVEIVTTPQSVNKAFWGRVNEAHETAKDSLVQTHTKKVEKLHHSIGLSPGAGLDTTLSLSLNCIWNILPALRKNGSVCVLAECSEGLGSPALDLVCTGRLEALSRKDLRYVRGLEQILCLREVQEEHEVCLVSSLPHYYVHDKLKMKPLPKAKNIVERTLQRDGSKAKVALCPSGQAILVKPTAKS